MPRTLIPEIARVTPNRHLIVLKVLYSRSASYRAAAGDPSMNKPSILIPLSAASFFLPICVRAQWLNHPDLATPRARDGAPNLSAEAPRAANGKPDLSGIWQPEAASGEQLARYFRGGVNGLGEDDPTVYFLNILSDFKPAEAPLLPSAAAAFGARAGGLGRDVPATRCQPWGMPMLDTVPSPSKIVQTPGVVYILSEADMSFRQIYTDGRQHTPDPQPSWLGYSVGRWEGDTLVVDTVGFNDRSWLDAIGHPHSEAMRVTERFRRLDFGHTELQLTVDDPKTYTQPFTVKFNLRLLPDTDLIESFCSENEKDAQHLSAR